ncbi:MAG: peptidoglycan DD-metalloendopeptidase family protein [Rikenellaceae bacterium]|nr:peptidoglycan DD-metalloendopeptidase family protein [Rikenellaceae bacterium]
MRYLLTIAFVAVCLYAEGQTVDALKKNIAHAEAEIKKSNELLKDNKNRQKSSLSNLALVGSNIKNRKSIIESLDGQAQIIRNDISHNNKSLDTLSRNLSRLKKEYAAIAVTAYKEYKTGNYVTFIFLAKDLGEMTRRAAYLRRHMEIRRLKGAEITRTSQRIAQETNRLHEREKELAATLESRSREMAKLAAEEAGYRKEIESLRKEEKNIGSSIAKNRNTIERLQKEIRKIIEEQARKDAAGNVSNAALAKLTGNFTAAKGKLPYPVAGGVITEFFGIHPHPLQPTLKIDNKGVTFTAKSSSNARAVFAGQVTKVFILQGMGTTVMVRHGSYITVFSNLSKAFVKAGDKVTAGQHIGVISSENTLHFELWKETTPINPQPWFVK